MIRKASHWSLATMLAFAIAISTIGFGHPTKASADEASCGEHGTSVVFADSPIEAAKQAMEEEKLVFVLHVSGNFETPEYT